jgi:beta-mannanase
VPEHGAYTGAFIDFGDTEDDVTLEAIENFEDLVGKHQAIIASSSYWGEQTFPTENINLIWRHGSIPLIFWSPWDKPYDEDSGPDKFSLSAIIEGKWDAYIDQWAESARQFGQPMFVSFCNEMNGTWFPWSGCFYGGKNVVPGTNPKKYEGPEVFKTAYRHVVDRVRAKGATNILWVFHVMNYSYPQDVWNLAAQYYPGPDYVDWLGLSVYGEQDREDPWVDFIPLMEWPYEEMRRIDPGKPVMLAEWGIGEFPKFGKKSQFISDFFSSMKSKYPNVKAAVFWHERWQNEDDAYSNLRVNSTPEAQEAYRNGVGDPYWLGDPLLQPAKKR